MSSRIVYHLTHANADDRWHLKHVGGRAAGSFATKEEATRAGQKLGHDHEAGGELAQLVIHHKDGSIETEYTYGKDPRDIPG